MENVYHYFRIWRLNGTWERINACLRTEIRIVENRNPEPSAAVLDSQSVKTTETPGIRGYDAGKKVNGRKLHILVDTLGLLMMVIVHAENIQDRDGAMLVLGNVKGKFRRLQLIWADDGYAGKLIGWVKEFCGWMLEIIKRNDRYQRFPCSSSSMGS